MAVCSSISKDDFVDKLTCKLIGNKRIYCFDFSGNDSVSILVNFRYFYGDSSFVNEVNGTNCVVDSYEGDYAGFICFFDFLMDSR